MEPMESAVRRLFKHLSSRISKARARPTVFGKLKETFRSKILDRWKATYLESLIPMKNVSFGNTVKLYSNGSECFTDMWDAIDTAKRRVWIETYILEPDFVGVKTIDKLADAAKRGCNVILVYDRIGSFKITDWHLRKLHQANGQSQAFYKAFWFRPRNVPLDFLLFRNHRKLLVVDNSVAFCGGMNLGGDYAGRDVGGTGRFRDSHARIEGPGVSLFAESFLNTLALNKDDTASSHREIEQLRSFNDGLQDHSLPLELPEVGEVSHVGSSTVHRNVMIQVLESNTRAKKRHIQDALLFALRNCQDSCLLTTPYFLPPKSIRTALVNTAARGVDVRILTAGTCDMPIAKLAAQHIYGYFLKHNIKMYELYPQELHAKLATFDGIISSIGSYNIDLLSYQHALEISMTVLDPGMAHALEEQFAEDMNRSKEITKEVVENRTTFAKVVHWAAYHLCNLVLSSGISPTSQLSSRD